MVIMRTFSVEIPRKGHTRPLEIHHTLRPDQWETRDQTNQEAEKASLISYVFSHYARFGNFVVQFQWTKRLCINIGINFVQGPSDPPLVAPYMSPRAATVTHTKRNSTFLGILVLKPASPSSMVIAIRNPALLVGCVLIFVPISLVFFPPGLWSRFSSNYLSRITLQ